MSTYKRGAISENQRYLMAIAVLVLAFTLAALVGCSSGASGSSAVSSSNATESSASQAESRSIAIDMSSEAADSSQSTRVDADRGLSAEDGAGVETLMGTYSIAGIGMLDAEGNLVQSAVTGKLSADAEEATVDFEAKSLLFHSTGTFGAYENGVLVYKVNDQEMTIYSESAPANFNYIVLMMDTSTQEPKPFGMITESLDINDTSAKRVAIYFE